MAQALKCDRCGTYGENEEFQFPRVDLCPCCAEEFNAWIAEKTQQSEPEPEPEGPEITE